MKEHSLVEFAAFATEMILEVDHRRRESLEIAAVAIEEGAKEAIGTYAYGWAPLAPSTLEKKAADTPLLETGQLRDSITHSVDANEARVGSNEDTAVWQELGTSHIPPRSFLVETATRKREQIIAAIGNEIFKLLTK